MTGIDASRTTPPSMRKSLPDMKPPSGPISSATTSGAQRTFLRQARTAAIGSAAAEFQSASAEVA
jgi:hypothetical protein